MKKSVLPYNKKNTQCCNDYLGVNRKNRLTCYFNHDLNIMSVVLKVDNYFLTC